MIVFNPRERIYSVLSDRFNYAQNFLKKEEIKKTVVILSTKAMSEGVFWNVRPEKTMSVEKDGSMLSTTFISHLLIGTHPGNETELMNASHIK